MQNHRSELLLNQARKHMMVNDYAAASPLVSEALGLDPKNVRGLAFGAVVAAKTGQRDRALEFIENALDLEPNDPRVIKNAAGVFFQCGEPHRARALWERLIELSPPSVETLYNLAVYHLNQNDVSAAEMYYRKAMTLAPNERVLKTQLGNMLFAGGRVEEAIAMYREGECLRNGDNRQSSNYLLALNYDPSYSPEQIQAEHISWGRDLEAAAPAPGGYANDTSPNRRLRIGYVSPDFRVHVVGYNLLPLLRKHDHSQFEIYCYSDTERPDEMTDRFRLCADIWRDTAKLSDAELATQVSQDRIDVLVDLVMHAQGTRLVMFVRKPAPIQVTWLAYPGSTGLTRMDYRFTDPVLDPPGQTDHFYTEQSIRLETFWCYEPHADSPAVGPLPAEKNGYITFGCLNSFIKINNAVLALWREILAAVPNSRLVLVPPKGKTGDWVMEKLQVAADRLICLPRISLNRYLEYYNRMDLALDPFPFTGGITTIDSLWMGVPVITLPGPTVVSRGSLSILSNLGLPELAVKSKSDYVALAVALSRDLTRLRELRTGLRGRFEHSVLMDATRFARRMESAYRDMWREWCGHSSSKPESA